LNTNPDLIHTFDIAETPEYKGVIELLWDVFGGTVNEQGYKVLDPHIGAIYGDSITIDRADEICKRLKEKGFASTNVVLGVGSYSMGYATRDNQGGAVKATYVEVNGEGREIFKDPITDDGTKKSATGLLCVTDAFGEYQLTDKVDWDTEKRGELKTIYKDGEFFNETTLTEIRSRLTQLATQTV
jgi:nicotinamide phosphoribosyltransferase